MAPQVKKLDNGGLGKVQDLERKLGCCVVALERQPHAATLSRAQLQELQSLEREMDAILVAYRCDSQSPPP